MVRLVPPLIWRLAILRFETVACFVAEQPEVRVAEEPVQLHDQPVAVWVNPPGLPAEHMLAEVGASEIVFPLMAELQVP